MGSSLHESINIEEYKRLANLINDLQKQMIYIASGSIGAYTIIWAAIIKDFLLNKSAIYKSIDSIYLYLVPLALIIPAFYILVGHRSEICRAASYLLVFYENKLNRLGWDGGVASFRYRQKTQEAHGSIPLVIYWVWMGLSCLPTSLPFPPMKS